MGHATNTKPCLEVETDEAIYEIELGPVQLEITGRCNMDCEHCRGSNLDRKDMPLAEITKIMKFVRKFSPSYKEITLSGGEPFLHHDFRGE